MGSFTTYLADALLDHVFGSGEGQTLSYTQPAKWIALCTVAVTDSATGTTITECNEAGRYGYARVQMNTWDVAASGATENTNDILFAQATGSWGTVLDFAICDSEAVGSGNVLAYGSLTVSKSVQSGDTPKFATNDLDITLT